ncbi:CDP-glucose 4,6-dehydratase [Rhodovulum sp. BSW8]|nr:CDP-glucose 4,6-dehydratase [Rhodovulum sp. BSW8]
MEDLGVSFWAGKRVLLTGHTGFKGAWAGRWLARRGAEVTGISLPPEPGPALYDSLGQDHLAASHMADLRDAGRTAELVRAARPEIVLHLAAQPLVRRSYADPVLTFGSNVMGTVHLLDALRREAALRAVLVVTSDKVYENDTSGRAFAETDRLGGHDPYSASKAATEIAVASFRRAFFAEAGVPLATARGGNVIGGGDFSADRLVPDIVRALMADTPPEIRNPGATRPWQHVLDCLDGYLTFVQALAEGRALPEALNFGPAPGTPAVTVAELAEGLYAALGRPPTLGTPAERGPHEMAHLAIDAGLAARTLGWRPRLSGAETLDLTARWYAGFLAGEDAARLTDQQIDQYQDRTP